MTNDERKMPADSVGDVSAEQAADPSGASRRTIVKGAAWSVPVISMAAAAPSAAASAVCAPYTYAAPTPPAGAGVSNARTQTTWTVPTGVTTLNFSVAGGAGALSVTANPSTYDGRLVTGQISVQPGWVLTLVVGQGGARGSRVGHGVLTEGSGAIAQLGGEGYGKGGDVPGSDYHLSDWPSHQIGAAGSGGGGSAIVLGTTPLVVAGGGRGQGANTGEVGATADSFFEPDGNIPELGPNVARYRQGTSERWVAHQTGFSGTSSAPGSGATVATANTSGPGYDSHGGRPGFSGAAHAGGGNGGDGRRLGVTTVLGSGGPRVAEGASGGGGGGYNGGGSGTVVAARYYASGSLSWTVHSSGNSGGIGGSYWAPTATATTTVAGNAVGSGDAYRSPGWINLSYEQCL